MYCSVGFAGYVAVWETLQNPLNNTVEQDAKIWYIYIYIYIYMSIYFNSYSFDVDCMSVFYIIPRISSDYFHVQQGKMVLCACPVGVESQCLSITKVSASRIMPGSVIFQV
jgi:hypothetical protein